MKTIVIYNREMRSSESIKPPPAEHMPKTGIRRWLNADSCGIVASIVCLIHCLALPVAAIALPAFAVTHGREDLTHFLLAGFVAAFCLFAIVPGYKLHRNREVLIGMLTGVFLVMFATFIADPLMGHLWEMPIITVGNLIVVSAHIRNRKLLSVAKCC